MTKRTSKPQIARKCIFCENNASRRGEHFWPEWMHKLLPSLPNPRYDRRIYHYHPKTGRTEEGPKAKPGALHTITIRAVCEACNTGWMNRIEGETRPFLQPLVEGTPIALDFEQMAVIARWVTLKCIVAEHAAVNTSLTPPADRLAFKEFGKIPSYFRIYVANHGMPNAAGFIRHSRYLIALDGVPTTPPLEGTARNMQTISFVLGRLFVHLNAARISNYDLESRYTLIPFHQHCRIWPFQHHEMVWPRRPWFDREGMSKIAATLDAIQRNAKVTWPDDGGGVSPR